ncbi:MAG: sugar nucleotide-binding protein [Planctomycetes bacterium]|nr:sugar nucleotide-binding protein [Planctomycetota bacterium]
MPAAAARRNSPGKWRTWGMAHRGVLSSMEANVDKLLLTGAETLVGANLALALRDRWQVTTLGADPSNSVEGCAFQSCDLADADEVAAVASNVSPRWIVHCGALSQSSWDLQSQDSFDTAGEMQIVQALMAAAHRSGAQLAALTTDAAFCGPRMFHAEISPATGASPAADAARALERALLGNASLVIRSHVYGWSPAGTPASFAEQVYEQLSQGLPCPVDAQNYATPILVTDLAELMHRALTVDLRGVYHLTGAERTSQYRFAAEMAVAFGLTGKQVRLEPPARRSTTRAYHDETSLNTALARRELRVPLPMLREGLFRFAEQTVNGHRESLLTPSRHDFQHAA